jgi:hypothetical protein
MFYRTETDHQEAEEVVQKRERALRILQIVLLALFVSAFAKLYAGPYPWSKSVIQRITKEAPDVQNPKSLTEFSAWLKSEVSHPKLLRAKDHGIIGTWYGAGFAAGAAFLLLLTTRFWLPRGGREGRQLIVEEEADAENAGESGFAKLLSGGPLFYVLVIAAMATGAWLRMPAMSHSLWNDEEYAMRRFAHGEWKEPADGALKKQFEPVEWSDTLFEAHNGNNHLLHSLLSRVSLSTWRSFTKDAKPSDFNETALRMPSLIAGVLTLALIAMLGWEFGLPWVGIGAAWMLALHPWHIRYSAEAKGYSLCVFFVCLALLGLVRAMRHNEWKHWLLFAIGEAGFLLSFGGSIYVAMGINLVAVLECLVRRQPQRFAALIAFNLLAAIPVIWWSLPSVPQMIGFLDHGYSHNLKPDSGWIYDFGSHLAAGIMQSNPDSTEHIGTSWEQLRGPKMDATSILGWSVLLLGFLGFAVSPFENVASRVCILGLTVAGALSFWHAGVQHHPNLPMYYIYLLVPLTLACGLAVVRFQFFPAILVIVLAGLYGVGTQKPRVIFMEHDRQPIRQTVEAIYDKKPAALTGVFGVSDRQAQSYDPEVAILEKPQDVDALLAKGKTEGRPVFVYFAGLRESASRSPELMKRVAQSPDFVPFKDMKGLEAMFSYHIYAQPGVR